MAEIIRDSFDGKPAQVVPLERATDEEVRRLAVAGSREAAREWVRRRRRQR